MENLTSFYYRYLRYMQAKDDTFATSYDKYMALSYAVRSRMVDRWIETQKMYHVLDPRRVYFLSTEYLWGKNLKHYIVNLGLEKNASEAAENLGFTLEELYNEEDDFELGNAGRGRLAACIMDSMSTHNIAGMGYGLYYDYALFKQKMQNGFQTEQPSDWIQKAHPWEVRRPEYSYLVQFNGSALKNTTANQPENNPWHGTDTVIAIPYDFPVPGFQNSTVNTLRLWSSQASEEFLHDYQNHRDYIRACEDKYHSGKLTNFLFPDESIHRATEMRIKQLYFFVSASLQDIIRRYKMHNANIIELDKKIVIHLNGSRCAIAIPEMMRLLIDIEKINWLDAWKITRNIFSYTSHAMNFDGLEKWPIYLLEQILPRHLKIIYDINQQHLDHVPSKNSLKESIIRELSIIEEGEVKWVKMAHLAVLGSKFVNGVSLIQTEILEKKIFPSQSATLGMSFTNITSGISIRRWLLVANKGLAGLITELIGDKWITDFEEISKLKEFSTDTEVLARIADIKHTLKRHCGNYFQKKYNYSIDPDSLWDVNCKRMHPYKRLLLQLLYIIHQYLLLCNNKTVFPCRTHIFGGKASPSDFLAKQIIYLIHMIAGHISNNPVTKNKLQVFFIPNYGMSLAERIIPVADLSEHLSCALYESCGTSNAKFALNGSIILASRAGSNLELAEKVGEDGIILFGHSLKELTATKGYSPNALIETDSCLREIFAFLDEVIPKFPHGNVIYPLIASLRDSDPYFVLYDFADYYTKQMYIDSLYSNKAKWNALCLNNIACSGWFSSDRAIKTYCRDLWKITP